MKDQALGDYLRKEGLHSAQLGGWKEEAFFGMKISPGRPKKYSEVVELKHKEKRLEKELHRKDRALAEMAARIILLKKSRSGRDRICNFFYIHGASASHGNVHFMILRQRIFGNRTHDL